MTSSSGSKFLIMRTRIMTRRAIVAKAVRPARSQPAEVVADFLLEILNRTPELLTPLALRSSWFVHFDLTDNDKRGDDGQRSRPMSARHWGRSSAQVGEGPALRASAGIGPRRGITYHWKSSGNRAITIVSCRGVVRRLLFQSRQPRLGLRSQKTDDQQSTLERHPIQKRVLLTASTKRNSILFVAVPRSRKPTWLKPQ